MSFTDQRRSVTDTTHHFNGLLAQLRRAAACRAEGRGSNARTGRHFTIAREEDSNPPRLGRGDTRGSTEARDHFIHAPVAERIRHLPSKQDDAGENPARSARFLSTHRVCGPPVKRCELGAMPRGGAISQTERVRSVEDAVLKTVALLSVSGVQVPGAPPSARMVQ